MLTHVKKKASFVLFKGFKDSQTNNNQTEKILILHKDRLTLAEWWKRLSAKRRENPQSCKAHI